MAQQHNTNGNYSSAYPGQNFQATVQPQIQRATTEPFPGQASTTNHVTATHSSVPGGYAPQYNAPPYIPHAAYGQYMYQTSPMGPVGAPRPSSHTSYGVGPNGYVTKTKTKYGHYKGYDGQGNGRKFKAKKFKGNKYKAKKFKVKKFKAKKFKTKKFKGSKYGHAYYQ
mmetsp:Transcript_4922/g.5332  ORF Transcript_4922/g.5332 Transcript_4922/m.5332 type:complete len:168 (+) Transcript_4922:23-526(+)